MTQRKTWVNSIKNWSKVKIKTRRILKTAWMGMTPFCKERGSHSLKVLRRFWVKGTRRILKMIATCNFRKENGKAMNFIKRDSKTSEKVY